ncbi:MAG: Gfo/Idh/MocA family oxidoreductase [Gammaproteobacteria bacterium]|nr:Gfo/Idh/MocA family oxidoreductase [Gammaproteobacteria bacterium]
MGDSKTERLQIAFIGAGGIARTHMRYLHKMDDVDIVSVADVVESSAAKLQEEFGIPSCYTDYQQMLSEVRPQAVSVCTPNGLHAPCTLASLEAGADVLVEKPLAMNAIEGTQMVEAAKANSRKLVIGFQHRFEPRTRFLRNAVRDGKLGEILYGRVQALRRRGIPNWGVFGRKELQGGGPLIDIGVHVLETAHFVMGSPNPIAALGQTYRYLGDKPSTVESEWPNWDFKTYDVEDLAVGMIRFENGATLSVEASFAAHVEKDNWNFALMGTKGGATWGPPRIFHDEHNHMVNTEPHWLPERVRGDAFRLKMRNFVDHALHDHETLAPAEHGLMVQKMLDGIYRSAEQGREVRIE